jgi:hypothetical protein
VAKHDRIDAEQGLAYPTSSRSMWWRGKACLGPFIFRSSPVSDESVSHMARFLDADDSNPRRGCRWNAHRERLRRPLIPPTDDRTSTPAVDRARMRSCVKPLIAQNVSKLFFFFFFFASHCVRASIQRKPQTGATSLPSCRGHRGIGLQKLFLLPILFLRALCFFSSPFARPPPFPQSPAWWHIQAALWRWKAKRSRAHSRSRSR